MLSIIASFMELKIHFMIRKAATTLRIATFKGPSTSSLEMANHSMRFATIIIALQISST